MKKNIFLLSALLLSACSVQSKREEIYLTSPDAGRVSLQVEIADTAEERQVGLMQRGDVPEGTGMLFVFDGPGQHSFWMKNTFVSLDILFFDTRNKLSSWARMIPCTEDPCITYVAPENTLYALELPAGFSDTYTLHSDWKLILPEN